MNTSANFCEALESTFNASYGVLPGVLVAAFDVVPQHRYRSLETVFSTPRFVASTMQTIHRCSGDELALVEERHKLALLP